MKKSIAILAFSVLFLNNMVAQSIIPKPNKIEFEKGSFSINNRTSINGSSETKEIALIIQEFFGVKNGINLKIENSTKSLKISSN